jgi:hypothetical protein
MQRTRSLRIALGLACAAALAVPVVGQAGQSSSKGDGRTFYATDNQGNLLSFSTDNPRKLDSMRSITGLPAGVTLTGIDFRPRTGDLYGSDSVVYRVNPQTAIAVPESSATPPTPFTPALRGRFFGVDFNPMVDRIRVTSDANQNIRLHPDDANVVGADADLNPGDPTVVGSAYTNSSFSAGLASSTVLYALDDAIYVQSPPNNGTRAMPQQLDINVRGRQRVRHRRPEQLGLRRHRLRSAARGGAPPRQRPDRRQRQARPDRPWRPHDHRPRGRAGPLLEDPPYSERGRATARGPAPRRAPPLPAALFASAPSARPPERGRDPRNPPLMSIDVTAHPRQNGAHNRQAIRDRLMTLEGGEVTWQSS